MAHPYAKYNEHDVAHARVGGIMRHEPKSQKRHDGKAWSHEVRSKHAAVAHNKIHGGKKPGRFARGGKVKGGGHHTNIAVVVPQGRGPQAGAAGAPGGGPPMPAGPALPPGLPPGGPPGMPPGMPPPGLKPPGMRRGGRIKRRADGGTADAGDASKPNLDKWASYASKNSYARGGRLPDAGALSGEGRLQKAALQKRRG